jgi:hypothetical protein
MSVLDGGEWLSLVLVGWALEPVFTLMDQKNLALLPQISPHHAVRILVTVLMMFPQILEYSGNKLILRLSCIFQKQECGFSTLHVHAIGDRGSAVVKVLGYKSEGRWFDPRWCHRTFN